MTTTDAKVDWVKRWEGAEGAHWVDEAERYDTMNRAFGDAMLDTADLRPGERVLDVGCGNGATTISVSESGRDAQFFTRAKPRLCPPQLATRCIRTALA